MCRAGDASGMVDRGILAAVVCGAWGKPDYVDGGTSMCAVGGCV